MFGMFGLWSTFSSALSYLTLAVCLGGLAGNGLVLWHLGLHIKKGPFSVYVLHLAAADFLFLCCQTAAFVAQTALGVRDTLYLAITFVGFSAGLGLLAAFSAERCLSYVCPTCYAGCRPRHTSGVACGLLWALSPPAVLLPAHACGLLRARASPLACLRHQAASVAWLLSLACTACAAALLLFLWVTCCSQRPRPKFYGIALGSALLLFFCGLPLVVYWSLRPFLNLLLPVFLPLATLLACVHSSAKPLICFAAGRQPGRREPLRAVLQRALGEEAGLGARGQSLPMGLI
ncbi:mas-related G-protein coupled receptor member G [Suricata suricatta]|uniref:mas-related G-protein coupled receptor member G n=1 Tax=Suricata suricatta TaxID=37032 RepID=UPI001156470E|nr:mas-related G-protein coupled receptor member G [Suricata suricatta]